MQSFPEKTIIRLADYIGIPLKKYGSTYMGRCPSCKSGDNTPNTGYDPSKNIWHCFSCDAGGHMKDLCNLENFNFVESMNAIGVGLNPRSGGIQNVTTQIKKPMGPCEFVSGDLSEDVKRYLESRYVDPDVVGSEVMTIANNADLPPEFSKRLKTHNFVIPMYLPSGELYSIKFRSPNGHTPKTLNKMGCGTCMIGWRNVEKMRSKDEVIIVEGEIDYLTMLSAGFDNVLAIPSTTYSIKQQEINCLPSNVIVMFDSDDSGYHAGRKLAEKINKGRNVFLCDVSSERDINDTIQSFCGDYDRFRDFVSQNITAARKNPYSPFGAVSRRASQMSSNIYSLVQDALKNGKERPDLRIIPTGQEDIDKMLNGGLRDGLTGICGAPGVGKTTLFLALAKSIVENNPNVYVVFVSIEMTAEELTAQFLSWVTGISKRKILDNDIDRNGAELLQQADLSCYDRIILNDRVRTAKEIDSFVDDVIGHTGSRCIVMVDYLQQIKHHDPRMDERRAISENAYELKEIANRKRIPVVFISSTTRENYKNGELVGNALAAFKGSGDIEYSLYVGLYFSTVKKEEIENYSLDKNEDGSHCENPFHAVLVKNRHGSVRDNNGEYLTSTLSVSFKTGLIKTPFQKVYSSYSRDNF